MKKNLFRSLAAAILVFTTLSVLADSKFLSVYFRGNIIYETLANNIDSIAITSEGRMIRLYDANGKILYNKMRSGIDSIVFQSYNSYPKFNLGHSNQISASLDAATGFYTFNTTGADPYIYTYGISKKLSDKACVLTFSYLCEKGTGDIQVFFCDPTTEARSLNVGSLPATTGSQWKTVSYNIKTQRDNFNWGYTAGDRLRIDFGTAADVSIQVRSLGIRGMTAEEEKAQEVKDSIDAAKKKTAVNIKKYLQTTYASTVDSVTAGTEQMTVKGHCSNATDTFALVEVTPYEDVTEVSHFPYRTKITEQDFTITLPRNIKREGCEYDRVLSKWAVVKVNGEKDELDSHAHYADSVTASYQAVAGVLKGKKGVGAGGGSTYYYDFKALQLHSITSNVVLSSIIYTESGSGRSAYTYGGNTYYIDMNAVSGYDAMYKEAAKYGIIVSAIILTPTGSIFNDPENEGGYYTMPNMTTAKAVNLYAAALNFLAKRYSSGTYGRIHHWIMHNEVDMGSDWTNMGDQPEMRFYDRYMKSMRLCYNIVRQYDQHASILGSYTHIWNDTSSDYAPKLMLEQNVQYSACEGDFRWGVAYHPYPIDLTKPKFWVNDKNEATFSKNSKYVTFYNPEVINDWILDKSHFYKDGTKRILFFSEQGTNSPSYSDEDLALQAAGAAWMWKKISKLDGIDAMQWHNWADNAYEFGLRIGLRAYAEGDYTSLEPKPVWYVWQAADTENEDSVFQPYLSVLGISNWNNLIQTVR